MIVATWRGVPLLVMGLGQAAGYPWVWQVWRPDTGRGWTPEPLHINLRLWLQA